MNNKGFLLNELLICSAISFIILLAIFNTTISLNKKLSNLYLETKASTQQILFNKKVAVYFANDELNKIEHNSSNHYIFTFSNEKQMSLEYSNVDKYIIINNLDINNNEYDEKMNLNERMNINIDDNIVSCKPIEGQDEYLVTIKIPIKYEDSNKDFGIELYNITPTSCDNIMENI